MKNVQIKFIECGLDELKFCANRSFINVRRKKPVEIAPFIQIQFENENKNLNVKMEISITGEKMPFHIEVKYRGVFSLITDNKVPENKLKKIVYINCAAILYPFIREIIAETTRKSNIPPFILPPLNFENVYKQILGKKGKA